MTAPSSEGIDRNRELTMRLAGSAKTFTRIDGVSPEVATASKFRYEADMLQPLAKHSNKLTSTLSRVAQWSTYFEVPVSTCGIADILFVEVSPGVAEKRLAGGRSPILDLNELRCFIILQRVRIGFTAEEIAQRVGLSAVGLRRGPLKRLLSRGHVATDKVGRFTPAWRYVNPVRKIIAVEVKRTDWRGAMAQAKNYLSFADRSYIAMEPSAAMHAVNQSTWVDNLGIGVASVDATTRQVSVLRRGDRPSVGASRVHRYLAAEYILNLISSDATSGPISHVFGSNLSVSAGVDPRRQNGANLLLEELLPLG
ncbi:hypothetical protein ACIOD2_39665 [Amycolatopsis sp. NPDC088138]|uniref:hypothetical protein n=1 Tax=Amycolatopsis sp. NPDC088138 TaxID=3363938 RepID=UPI0037F9FD2F